MTTSTKPEIKSAMHLMSVLTTKGDCTNNGITRRLGTIHVWRVFLDGHLPRYHQVRDLVNGNHYMKDDDLVMALPRDGRPSLENPPAAMHVGAIREGNHVMAGGSYVSTSNGITHDDIGYSAPLSVHDRVE